MLDQRQHHERQAQGPVARAVEHRDAWIDVDLAAIVGNARLLGQLVPSGTQLAPVVKASAYGHGAAAVTLALEAAGYELFCVATVDEGITLRESGVRARILTLYEPPARAWSAADAAGLEIGVTSRPGLEKVVAEARQHPDRRIHLKLDTGMSRQGLLPGDVDLAMRHAARLEPITASIWTHLRDGASTASSGPQLAQFDAAVERLANSGLSAPRHAAASAAIMTGQGTDYEMVRPGLALFGMAPDEALAAGLSLPDGIRPALSIHARPVRLVRSPTGTSIGYGGTFVTERPTLLATLPLGYGDGLFRSLGNGRWSVLVGGQRAPIVGRVSMDGITVDVTDVDDVATDSVFTVLGRQEAEQLTGNDMALAAGTIPQEVLVRLNERLPHRYVHPEPTEP